MTTDRETAEVIRSWMKEETELDGAGIHRVLARLSDTPQRRHRWLWPFDLRLFTSGATRSADVDRMQAVDDRTGSSLPLSERFSTATGRTRLMFSPVKAIIAGTLVFVLGGAFLITQPLAQQDGVVPGAEVGGQPAATAIVTQDCDDIFATPIVCTWTADDPRLEGTLTHEWVADISAPEPDDTASIGWAQATLEGKDGSWTGHLYAVWGAEPASHLFVVLSGEGPYAGWQYVASTIDSGPEVGDSDWTGVIYEGEPPPFGPASASTND